MLSVRLGELEDSVGGRVRLAGVPSGGCFTTTGRPFSPVDSQPSSTSRAIALRAVAWLTESSPAMAWAFTCSPAANLRVASRPSRWP